LFALLFRRPGRPVQSWPWPRSTATPRRVIRISRLSPAAAQTSRSPRETAPNPPHDRADRRIRTRYRTRFPGAPQRRDPLNRAARAGMNRVPNPVPYRVSHPVRLAERVDTAIGKL